MKCRNIAHLLGRLFLVGVVFGVLCGLVGGEVVRADVVALPVPSVVGVSGGEVDQFRVAVAAGDVVRLSKREMPVDPYRAWDGKAGVPVGVQAVLDDPDYFRVALLSVQSYAQVGEPEVRAVALEALMDPTLERLDQATYTDIPAAQKKAEARIAGEQKKAREQLEAWRTSGEGGVVFKEQLGKALDSKDPKAWVGFVSWGAAAARVWDEKFAKVESDRRAELRVRLEVLSGFGGVIAERAKALLVSGSDAQIVEFFKSGYFEAATVDAKAREDRVKDRLAEFGKAKEATEQMRKARRVAELRVELVAAQQGLVSGVKIAANSLVLAAGGVRDAEAKRAANAAGGVHGPGTFDVMSSQVNQAREMVGPAKAEVVRAQNQIEVAVKELIDLGVVDAGKYSLVAGAGVLVVEAVDRNGAGARGSVDAIIAADAAKDQSEQAEANRRSAEQWLAWTKQQAQAAAEVAVEAEHQAEVAEQAVREAKAAREAAEAAEAEARKQYLVVVQQRDIAIHEAGEAKKFRQVAEAEEANAAQHRQAAEASAAQAACLRATAESEKAVAQQAAANAAGYEIKAEEALNKSEDAQSRAFQDRDAAREAYSAQRAAEAKAAYMRAAVEALTGKEGAEEARQAEKDADAEAVTARGAATNARTAADQASGAAVAARAASDQAEAAAARARVAADQAAAAAARADQAATKAEAASAEVSKQRMIAEQKATDARWHQVTAADAAKQAVVLTDEAGRLAREAMVGAKQTQVAADASVLNARAARVFAEDSRAAADAAQTAGRAAKNMADTSIQLVVPFTAESVAAKLVDQVGKLASANATELINLSEQAATKAEADAVQAEKDAAQAQAQVQPAFKAAADAAGSHAKAARATVRANKAMAEAATHMAAAEQAAARTAQVEADAQTEATKARTAADEANQDAQAASLAADKAQAHADTAKQAAARAEADATAAQQTATAAETAATTAEASAKKANEYATAAEKTAESAAQAAKEPEEWAQKTEQEEKEQQLKNVAEAVDQPSAEDKELVGEEMGPEELKALEEAARHAEPDWAKFIIDEGGQLILDLIGVNDAIKCFTNGDVAACLWTVINVATSAIGGFVFAKLGLGVAKIAAKVPKVLQTIEKGKDALKTLKKWRESKQLSKGCKKTGTCPLGSKGCFIAGTLVLLASGLSIPIEQIRIGDVVMATDVATGENSPQPVTATFKHEKNRH